MNYGSNLGLQVAQVAASPFAVRNTIRFYLKVPRTRFCLLPSQRSPKRMSPPGDPLVGGPSRRKPFGETKSTSLAGERAFQSWENPKLLKKSQSKSIWLKNSRSNVSVSYCPCFSPSLAAALRNYLRTDGGQELTGVLDQMVSMVFYSYLNNCFGQHVLCGAAQGLGAQGGGEGAEWEGR